MSVDPLSQVSVEQEILRTAGLLDKQVTEVAKRAKAAADAEADYKLAFAKHMLTLPMRADDGSKVTVGEREAAALLKCDELYRAHKGADAVLLAAQEAGRSYRARIDALRTLAANQRAATTYSEGVG